MKLFSLALVLSLGCLTLHADESAPSPSGKSIIITGDITHFKTPLRVKGEGVPNDGTYNEEVYGNSFTTKVAGLPSGTYTIEIDLAELFFQGPGQRIMKITSGDTVLADNLDLFAVAGFAKPYKVQAKIAHQDDAVHGPLAITFAAIKNKAKFNAIHLFDAQGKEVASVKACDLTAYTPPLEPLDHLPSSTFTPGLQSINLNGKWHLTGINPAGEKKIDIAARVPGMVHPALLKAGLIKDPFWRKQADECQWIENWDWAYSRDFTVPADFHGQSVVLRFEGLDTFATVKLNGQEIGKTRDMYIPHEFEVGTLIHPGVNHLEVYFLNVAKALEGKPLKTINDIFDQTHESPWVRKLECTFGWDWVNRFVSAGIWRPVTLTAYGDARIHDAFIYTSALGKDKATEQLEVAAEISQKAQGLNAGLQASYELIDPSGHTVWQQKQPLSESQKLTFDVPHPQLWWPNGAGAQPLYTAKITLSDADGKVLDTLPILTAIRTVKVDQTAGAFTPVINGVPIFAKGANWVPADPFPSEVTKARYDLLVGQAKAANMNILRSWGGGLYESPDFYAACARDGIMVTQDFLFGDSDYPDADPDFVNLVNREVALAIRMERNNPALVWWTGGNEMWESSRRIESRVAQPLTAQLDPRRPYFVNDPNGDGSDTSGQTHTDAVMHLERDAGLLQATPDYRLWTDIRTGRFMSEYEAPGSPPERSLLRFMAPSDLTDLDMWIYHTKFSYFEVVQALYGKSVDIHTVIKRREQVARDFVRWAMEAARRRKFMCSGIQFWMFNDCWPSTGWAFIDYWGNPKAGWYGMKSGSAPVIVALEPGKDVFRWSVCNDKLEPITAKLHVTIQPWTGAPRFSKDITATVAANTSQAVLEIPRADLFAQLGQDAVLVADLSYPGGTDRSTYFYGYPKKMNPPVAHVTAKQTRSGDEGTVTLHADNYARVVTLEADADFSDNYFDLLPGETRTITWKAIGDQPVGKIPVTWWNDSEAAVEANTVSHSLSEGKPATASSVDQGNVASNAFDGDDDTRWASQASDPQWIEVDLGAPTSFTRIVLSWETAHAAAYQVQTSDDNSTWQTIYSTTNGVGRNEKITFPTATARYVRLNLTQRATGWGYSLYGFDIYSK